MGARDDRDRYHNQRRDSVAWAAGLALDRWLREIGEAGLTAAYACPGLLAEVDQHAADVREALADRRGDVALPALAAYADGVNDTAARHGVDLTALARAALWARAPWPLVRMLGVCLLARARRPVA